MRLGGGLGPNECPHGCLGFGTCVAACPFDAIHIRDGVARVDHEKCVGCMACAAACPKHIIVRCLTTRTSPWPAPASRRARRCGSTCDIGCLGCKICEKTCEHDAIHVVDNLA